MSTSNRRLIAEVTVFAAVLITTLALVAPADPWMKDLGFQPAWIVVAVFSARYGSRGLFWSCALTWGGLTAVTIAAGIPLEALGRRVQQPEFLLAMAAMLLVAWMSMAHDGRVARSARRLAESNERAHHSAEAVTALRDGLEYMRARFDRIEMSLSFWRDIATRLERGDPAQAARAALDLCAVRCGASAGVVQRRDCVDGVIVAWYGAWTPWDPRPRDVSSDRTVCAAIAAGALTPVAEVDAASERDCDVAIPVVDRADGVVVGVIALRGVGPGSLRAADVRDLAIIADWLSPSLATLVRRPRLRAVAEETRGWST